MKPAPLIDPVNKMYVLHFCGQTVDRLLGCGVKQQTAPGFSHRQHTWTGAGRSPGGWPVPAGLPCPERGGWENEKVWGDEKVWGVGGFWRHVTQQTCQNGGAIFHFCPDAKTIRAQAALIPPDSKGVPSPVRCQDAVLLWDGPSLSPGLLSSFVWFSQLIVHHQRFSFFGPRMGECASWGALSTEGLSPSTEAAVMQTGCPGAWEKCSYLQPPDLWGLISAVLTSSIRKSPAPPLLHGQPFSPVTGCIHKYSLFADCVYVRVCVCGRFRNTPAHLQWRGVGAKTGRHGSGRIVCRVASEKHPSLQQMTVCWLQLLMQIQ